MEDLGTLNLSSHRIPPPLPIRTSHGGLWDFGSELTQNSPPPFQLELLMEGCGTSDLSSHRIPPFPPELELLMEDFVSWNGVWKLLLVDLVLYLVYLHHCMTPIYRPNVSHDDHLSQNNLLDMLHPCP